MNDAPCHHVWNYGEQIEGFLAERWCVYCAVTQYSDDVRRWEE